MFIHRRAPKSVTSRGTDFGDSEANPGPPKTPKTPSKSWSWRPIFGGFPGGLWGVSWGSFLGQKWGFSDPPENTGFPGVRGAEKVLI